MTGLVHGTGEDGFAGTPVVLATVGTDHHRFDRLMLWIERWLGSYPDPVRCIVQHGTSRTVHGAEGYDVLSPDAFRTLLTIADVVVTQGGPGSIMDSRAAGKVPIVVPRLRAFGEVVDDHQLAFARRLARDGQIRLAETEDDLVDLIEKALADASQFDVVIDLTDARVEAMVRRFGQLVDVVMLPDASGGLARNLLRPRSWLRR